MPQLFRSSEVLAFKIGMIALLVGSAAAFVTVYRSLGGPVQVGDAPLQPIPFSHEHHAGADGIDCRYCHSTVETSANAGIPSTHVCLSCHSQLFADAPLLQPLLDSARTGVPLAWTRVNSLPDFVYFDHSAHIARQVGCIECHGRVERMPLMRRAAPLEMQWCLDCHRNPRLRPAERVFDTAWTGPWTDAENRALVRMLHLLDERRMTDCSTCHR